MKVLTLVALLATIFCATAVRADDLTYDDPGMHYRAPDGWERITITSDAAQQEGAPVAIFALRSGKNVSKTITITVADYDGALADFVTDRTQAMRSSSSGSDDSIFVDKKIPTKTGNGMPAVELIWTGTPANGPQSKSYEWLMIDGKRSIDVRYSGALGEINDTDAATVFSSLYVVAYPRPRPS